MHSRRTTSAPRRDGLLNNTFRHDITAAGIEPAPATVADLIGIEPDQPIVVRRRDLYDDSDKLQEIGTSYLPAEFAAGTFLAEPTVVPKALFRCVEDITGRRYAHATDQWISRPASVEEAERFDLTLGAYVLHVTHTARDDQGEVLEVSESIWPADRVSLIEDYDIPAEADQTATGSDI